jgi:ribosomal protein L10
LRTAQSDEAHVVRRLAALDDAPALEGPVLLAVMDGEPVAAISLVDRRVVANPFVPTGDVVELLRVRADHIHGPDPSSRRHRPTLLRRAA